jgi:hypothetical protein
MEAPESPQLNKAAADAMHWHEGRLSSSDLAARRWSTQEWLYFLRALPAVSDPARLAELENTMERYAPHNAEVTSQWLVAAIRNGYAGADTALSDFLGSTGRLKYLRRVYMAMAETREGRQHARSLLEKWRDKYHPVSTATLQAILDEAEHRFH